MEKKTLTQIINESAAKRLPELIKQEIAQYEEDVKFLLLVLEKEAEKKAKPKR